MQYKTGIKSRSIPCIFDAWWKALIVQGNTEGCGRKVPGILVSNLLELRWGAEWLFSSSSSSLNWGKCQVTTCAASTCFYRIERKTHLIVHPATCSLEGKNVNSDPFHHFRVDAYFDIEDCQAACANNSRCEWATMGNDHCHFKPAGEIKEASSGVVIAPKFCGEIFIHFLYLWVTTERSWFRDALEWLPSCFSSSAKTLLLRKIIN